MRDRQHKQKIDSIKASKGIIAANANAKSLLEDATLLFKNERYARAISLAILSIEESGKPTILRSILLEEDAKEISKKWKEYRNHHYKNTKWIVPELIANGARQIEDFKKNSRGRI
jgi:AbiV family abortive infection protein